MKKSLEDQCFVEAVANMPCGVLVSRNRNIEYLNQALADLLGISQEALTGKNAADLDPDMGRIFAKEKEEIDFVQSNGDFRTIRLSKVYQAKDDIEFRFFEECTRERKLAKQAADLGNEVKHLTMTDPTTGLMTEHALMVALEPQVSRSRRYKNPISVLRIALANGSAEDTDAMKRVGQCLKAELRWADLVGRSQDGDFIVVLPETRTDDAKNIAEKLTSRLAESFRNDSSKTNTPPIFGITEWNKTDDAKTMIQRAGAALHEAQAQENIHIK